eukprot:GHVT01045348.1.p2 GENE.GHVT01045348.1~~GHVT01045348.1.p2  ORF type:complete len:122 (-),score=18.41 GHVT01045348.1:55-420(-)
MQFTAGAAAAGRWGGGGGENVCRHSCVLVSQTFTLPSLLPVTTRCPSAATNIPKTGTVKATLYSKAPKDDPVSPPPAFPPRSRRRHEILPLGDQEPQRGGSCRHKANAKHDPAQTTRTAPR